MRSRRSAESSTITARIPSRCWVSPNATLEEMSLAAKLARSLGSANVEFRLRQSDFTVDGLRAGTPWLGLAIDEVAQLDSALVVGSFLRKDHPLLAQRLRQAARHGAKLSLLSGSADDQLMPLANNVAIAPSQWPAALGRGVGQCSPRRRARALRLRSLIWLQAATRRSPKRWPTHCSRVNGARCWPATQSSSIPVTR